ARPKRDRAAAAPGDVHPQSARGRVGRGEQSDHACERKHASHGLPMTIATLPRASRYSPAAGCCAITRPTCDRFARRAVTAPRRQSARVSRCLAAATVIPITRGTVHTVGAGGGGAAVVVVAGARSKVALAA